MFGLKSESDELLTLDFLRFVAALGVVALHYGEPLATRLGGDPGRLGFLALWVDVFFVISGFVISHVYAGRMRTVSAYGTFLRRRLARLAPLHWATLGFYVALGLAMLAVGVKSQSPGTFAWDTLPQQVLFLHAFGTTNVASFNFPSWSISAEMAMYVLLPVFLRLRGWIWLLAIAAPALLWIFDPAWSARTYELGVLRAFAGFAFGMALYRVRDRLALIPIPFPLLLASIGAFILLGATGAPTRWLGPLAFLIAALAVATDMKGSPAVVKRVGPLGQLTYSLYMLHMPVRTLLIAYVGEHALHLGGAAYVGWILLAVLALFGLSYASWRWFEKPARRWISGQAMNTRRASKPAYPPGDIEPLRPAIATSPPQIDPTIGLSRRPDR
jgi:peptidoglycan/LPS O-acetylase OafA/YrhL